MKSKRELSIACGSRTDIKSKDYGFLCTAIASAVNNYLDETSESGIFLQIKYGKFDLIQGEKQSRDASPSEAWDVEKRSEQYNAVQPRFTFERLVLNGETKESIFTAVDLFKNYELIFNKWGLKANSPTPCAALNFFGKPGTGKTLAAHALAHRLKKKIIEASYAQIESMYHGEGPKNVEAIFRAAERQSAILFIDEADSLLSKRLTDVRQGSENAINSMRSQILICLEKFSGIVIFATNLISNYDRAFESRVRSIEFPMPNEECRKLLWEIHLPRNFPVDETVDASLLAKIDDVCGREIRNAVQMVAEKMASQGIVKASQQMLLEAITKLKENRFDNRSTSTHEIELTKSEKKELSKGLNELISTKRCVATDGTLKTT